MRAAFVVGSFPALSETFILNQVTGLIDRGVDVEVLAGRPRPSGPVHDDVGRYGLFERTHYPPRQPGSPPLAWAVGLGALAARSRGAVAAALRCVASLRRSEEPLRLLYAAAAAWGQGEAEIVHAHFGNWGVRALELRRLGLLRGRLVTTFHGYDVSRGLAESNRNPYAELFREGDLFLPISEHWRRRLLEAGCPAERTVVHRMGVDCRRFRFRPRVPDADGVLRLVSVARLAEKKGLDVGLKAAAALVRQGRRLVYSIAGDGPLRGDLEALSAELGLGDRVRFLGAQPQERIAELLDSAHLFLAPSVTAADGNQEGIPVVLMEAMSQGLPVVSTWHSGIPELVEDGVSGRLVPERDPEALAGAIEALAATPGSWPALGAAGRARVEAEFDIEKLNDRLVSLYRDLLGERAPGGGAPWSA